LGWLIDENLNQLIKEIEILKKQYKLLSCIITPSMNSSETLHSNIEGIEKELEVELLNRIKQEATSNISEKLPFLLPKKETEIVFLEKCPEKALYYGMWGNRHLIGIEKKDSNGAPEVYLDHLTRRLTHELIHQRFAEIIGVRKIIKNYDMYLANVNPENLSGHEICSLLNDSFQDNPPKPSLKYWGVAEAISFMGEKYIYEDERPLREVLQESSYPKEVLETIFSLDESVNHEEVPELLKKLIDSDFSE